MSIPVPDEPAQDEQPRNEHNHKRSRPQKANATPPKISPEGGSVSSTGKQEPLPNGIRNDDDTQIRFPTQLACLEEAEDIVPSIEMSDEELLPSKMSGRTRGSGRDERTAVDVSSSREVESEKPMDGIGGAALLLVSKYVEGQQKGEVEGEKGRSTSTAIKLEEDSDG